MIDEEKKQNHAERMKRKKAVVDAGMEKAQIERGILVLITGNGKGKSTSAFGTLYRALGHGHKAGVVQFIKGVQRSGEVVYLQQQAPHVQFHRIATGFTWDTQAWAHAARMLSDETLNLVVLDELTYMLKYNYLDLATVLEALRNRPYRQTVIVTGRAAKPELVELADTVSEIRDVKHAYRAGVKGQAGVDF